MQQKVVMQSAPQEVLDAIFSLVDDPNNLLPLALTCKAFKNLIIPFHIDYRLIRADISRIATWEHLLENPYFASRVLALEIVHEGNGKSERPIVPRSIAFNAGNISAWTIPESLIPAIRNMVNLRKFVCKILLLSEAVYKAISQSCPKLRALEVFCGGVDPETGGPLAHLNVWPNFHDLTQFSYSMRYSSDEDNFNHPQVPEERLQALISLLHQNCPELEDLQIDFCERGPNSLRGLFRDVFWPKLKHLNIQAVFVYEDHVTLFPSLPGLQALSITDTSITDGFGDNLIFDFTGLQSLRSIEIDYAPQLTNPIARNLTSLSFLIESDVRDDLYGFDEADPEGSNVLEIHDEYLNAIRDCENLRNLVVKSSVLYKHSLQSLLRVAPSTLERLAYDGTSWPEGDVLKNQDMDDLARMVNLTHLAFVGVDDLEVPSYAANSASATRSSIATLSLVVPKLTFVGLAPRGGSLPWIRINCDSAGRFSSYTKISKGKYQDDVDFNRWGGHYRGVKPVENFYGVEGPSWIGDAENDQTNDLVFVAEYEM